LKRLIARKASSTAVLKRSFQVKNGSVSLQPIPPFEAFDCKESFINGGVKTQF